MNPIPSEQDVAELLAGLTEEQLLRILEYIAELEGVE